MIIPDDLARRLQKNDDFIAWSILVADEIARLDTVKDLRELDNNLAGQVAKARDMAGDLIRDILKPVVNFKERTEHSLEEIQRAKKRVGL